ncbi:phosphatase PAP2 family protein [Streptomyces mobaraensis]|uniref:phosphatase PAP2 family protein n=1 Tax=Streptomyces mobaraensis TaxID=35621 RepID=UPI0033205C37
MSETPRPQGTADDAPPVRPQCRRGRATAHATGAASDADPGTPHRSDGRPFHTPRGERHAGQAGGLGTSPPVPEPPALRSSPLRKALLPALSAVLFALVTWQVAGHGPLRALDERVGRAVAGTAFPRAVTGFLADLGNASVAVPVLVAAALWAVLRRSRPWFHALAAALAMAAVPALVVPLKTLVDRPGPPAMGAGPHDGFFPSGHAATAAVAYGAALLLVTRSRRAAAGYALLNAAVGAALVHRGYHWPLDVLGSWCLAALVLWCLSRALSRGRAGRRPRAGRVPAPPDR